MTSIPVFRSTRTLDYSSSELGVVAVCGATLAVWSAMCAGSFSLLTLLMAELVCLSFYLVGSLIGSWRRLAAGLLFDLPLRLVAGYAAVNTALFVLAWISPLGIIANFAVVFGVALAIFVAGRPARAQSRSGGMGPWVVMLCLVAATVWCQDSLCPFQPTPDGLRVNPWQDSFYHAVHIRIFGAAHGASTIEDFRLAGVHARLYHYAAYLTPALVKQASGMTAYTAFAAILVPLGICMTGLAAYILFSSFWGPMPGLLASTALLFLPDGVQQGSDSAYLSYHWLIQISPNATFGLAIVALAWLLVIRGCQRGSRTQIIAGWMLGVVVMLYKAQFFIAVALPLILVPPLFVRGRLRRWHRVVWACASVVAYLTSVIVTQAVPGVPLIRLDGSSTAWLLDGLVRTCKSESLRIFLHAHIGSSQPWLINLVFGTLYLLGSSLGAFLLLFVGLAIAVRRRLPSLLVWFPIILIANFLVMAMGLARDTRGTGTPEELLHRPFMVMYFGVVAWLGASAGLLLTRWFQRSRITRVLVVLLPLSLLPLPAMFSSGVQRLRNSGLRYNLRIPPALFQAAEIMRTQGKPDDIFQDSSFDDNYVTAALSERRPYVEHMLVHVQHNDALINQRTAQVIDLMSTGEQAAVLAKAKALGIRWFLLRPGHQVGWPPTLASHPAFDIAGYRVYRFD
jgi:hypothetical protein